MYTQRLPVSLTADSSGAATEYSYAASGKITGVIYVPDAGEPFSDSVTIAVTIESTQEPVLSVTVADGDAGAFYYPRVATDKTDGTTNAGYDYIRLVQDRIKVVVGSGGNTKSGQVIFILE